MSKRTQRGLIILGSFAVLAIAAVIVAYGDEIVTFVARSIKGNSTVLNQTIDTAAFKREYDQAVSADTTNHRLTQALAKKQISREKYVLNFVRNLFAPERVESSLRGSVREDSRFGSPATTQQVLDEAVQNSAQYSLATQTELGELSGRPKGPFLVEPQNTQGSYLVHFKNESERSIAQDLVKDLEQGRDRATRFGLKLPALDDGCANRGEDNRIDVYMTSPFYPNYDPDYENYSIICEKKFPNPGAFLFAPTGADSLSTILITRSAVSYSYMRAEVRLTTIEPWALQATNGYLGYRFFQPTFTVTSPGYSGRVFTNLATVQQISPEKKFDTNFEPERSLARSRFIYFMTLEATRGLPETLTNLQKFWRQGGTVKKLKEIYGTRVFLDTIEDYSLYLGYAGYGSSVGLPEGSLYPRLATGASVTSHSEYPINLFTHSYPVSIEHIARGGVAFWRGSLVKNDGSLEKKIKFSFQAVPEDFAPLLFIILRDGSVQSKQLDQDPATEGLYTLTVDIPSDIDEFRLLGLELDIEKSSFYNYGAEFPEDCQEPSGGDSAGAGSQCPIGNTSGTIKQTHNASCDYGGVCTQVNPPPQQQTYSEGSRLACAPLYENYGTQNQIRRDYFEQHHLEGGLPVANTEQCNQNLWFFVYLDSNKNGVIDACGNDYDPPCASGRTPDQRLSGATVHVESQTDHTKYLDVTTNSIGEYQSGDIPADKYQISASKSGTLPTNQSSYLIDTTKSYGKVFNFLLTPN